MDSNINFRHLEYKNSNAVISFDNGTTFKVSKLMKQLNDFLQLSVLHKLSEKLHQVSLGSPPDYKANQWHNSVDAEILEPQSGKWKKGKVRMRVILEFCPDEPEEIETDHTQQNANLLDDIRQTISQ